MSTIQKNQVQNAYVNLRFSAFIFLLISLCITFDSIAQNLPSQTTQNLTQKMATQPSHNLDWKVWKENKNIKINYQKINNSNLIEIKTTLHVKSSISGFLLFIQDTKNIKQWLDNAKSSNVLKQLTPQENIFITRFKSYWPISARYMVVNSRYWQNDDLSLEIAVKDVIEKESLEKEYINNDMIKIAVVKAHWRIEPVDDQHIKIMYNIIADPKGAIPFWLTKRVSLNSLWKTMNNMHKQLPISPWQKQSLPNIKEHQHK